MDLRISSLMKTYDIHAGKKTNEVKRVSREEEKTDVVAISSQGRDYQVAKNAVMQSPDVRQDRVNEVKSKMTNGEYNIDSKTLANKMIENHAAQGLI